MTEFKFPHLKKKPNIHADVFIAPSAVVIADVEIGADSSLWYGVVCRGDVNEVRIGERSNIQDGCIIHVASAGPGTYIGNDVTVGHMAVLHACTLEDNAFIGIKACILDGATVESYGMLAAGAVLTSGKVVRNGELWAGVPAKPLRDITEAEHDMIDHSARRYVALSRRYLGGSIS